MPESSSQEGLISPWWVLLFLAVGLVGAWLAGQLQQAARPAAPRNEVAGSGEHATAVGSSGESRSRAGGAADRSAALDRTDERPRSAEVSPWMSLGAALAESERNGKPVLLDFNAEWCGPCRMMKQQVFDDWNLGKAVQTAVIPVSIVDRSREEGRNPPETEGLQQRYRVDAFPTLVVFSPRTGRSVSTRGYGGPQHTVGWILRAAEAVR